MAPDEQGTRNIALLGRYLEYLLDQPEDLAVLDGREVVLIPGDHPALAAANEALAERLKARLGGTEDALPVHSVPA